jgi:pilus assembly protein CpaC
VRLPILNWCASIMLCSAAAIAQAPPPQTQRELVLTVGKSLIVNSAANIERVAVGFGDVAEARAVGPREVLIDGKTAGETSLIIWQTGGNKLFFDVVVRPNNAAARGKLDTLRHQMEQQLPGQNINVAMENDSVVLTGTAKDLASAERAMAMALQVGKVVNLMYVEVPTTDPQILLKVQFATVDRNTSSELGLNLISTGGANMIGRVSTGQFGPPAVGIPPNSPPTVTLTDALNFFLFRPDLNLGATIKALETRGLFEILAEPNVLAINGKPASFLAGGEFPYPILQGGGAGLGSVTIAFREFGVRINFLPMITPRGTIRLDVAPEVSALDFTSGLTFQGFTIPGLTTRRVQTEIELQSGQSFAIGGLLDRRLQETLQKVPLLANIPLLGKLFQSRSMTRQNNELLVIVTPEIVRPIPEGQPLPHLENPIPLPGQGEVAPRTPGTAVTGQAPGVPPQSQAIPYEQLVDSIKKQNQMKLQEGRDLATWPGPQPANMLPGQTAPTAQQNPVK